jgi:hypothetical protein
LEESESSSEKSECLERATSNDDRNYRNEDLRRDSIRNNVMEDGKASSEIEDRYFMND